MTEDDKNGNYQDGGRDDDGDDDGVDDGGDDEDYDCCLVVASHQLVS